MRQTTDHCYADNTVEYVNQYTRAAPITKMCAPFNQPRSLQKEQASLVYNN